MSVQTLKVKRLNAGATLPFRATPHSAGADLFSCLLEGALILAPGERAVICTGIAVEIEQGFVGLVYARSGLAIKNGITLTNAVGVIDSDYRGEIKIGVINLSGEPFAITHGMRIAQLVLTPVALAQVAEVASLSATQRGQGGLGSTGK